MRVLTAEQMRAAEAAAIRDWGIPPLLLMENAAMQTVEHIHRMNPLPGRVVVVCGPGNNGGDGFAITRLLLTRRTDAVVLLVGDAVSIKGDARVNWDILCKMGAPLMVFPGFVVPDTGGGFISNATCDAATDVPALLHSADLVVDALFGTGLSRRLEGVFAEAVDMINHHAKKVLSVDIPSGVDANTGRVVGGVALHADETITFGFPKVGLLMYPGVEYAGDVRVVDISLPPTFEILGDGLRLETLTDADIPALLPGRPAWSHKGRFGRVCVLAGCRDMPGAAALCCGAAYRVGAGLVDACVVRDVATVIHRHIPEAITTTVTDVNGQYTLESRAGADESLEAASALLLGPGLGRGAAVRDFVFEILEDARCPVILDADGLNAVAEDMSVLRRINVPCVITPHPGEMSRLMGCETAGIVADPIGAAVSFAREHKVIVLLKGARTVIADPSGAVNINTTGNASLAKAGSGDALAGIISGLAAQGLDIRQAAVLGAYLHGKAGECASERLSPYGVNAGDVIDVIPLVMSEYR